MISAPASRNITQAEARPRRGDGAGGRSGAQTARKYADNCLTAIGRRISLGLGATLETLAAKARQPSALLLMPRWSLALQITPDNLFLIPIAARPRCSSWWAAARIPSRASRNLGRRRTWKRYLAMCQHGAFTPSVLLSCCKCASLKQTLTEVCSDWRTRLPAVPAAERLRHAGSTTSARDLRHRPAALTWLLRFSEAFADLRGDPLTQV